ncbi:Histidine kinase-, DNA gyrase B-, and HSP90-like ATPase [Chitinophaga eiseniae]|uniref:Oxygen sensor histidine kinase NreB n=1 Tax=Chitinophaga eiseniae TaxID=634771 RepID=A0A1T4TAL8_9BACT|nr:Histidine kinase-, DNA gyrase B-, and HSP90-like ATPase [Chitinophaga eiseniae]
MWLSLAGYRANGQQESYTDSLLRILDTAARDTARARLLFLLSDYWADKDSARAVDYAKKSFDYTTTTPFFRGLAHFYLAGAYFSYDKKRSQQEYMQADKWLEPFTMSEALQYRSRAWHNYGVLYQYMDDNRSFVNILLTKAIPLAQAAGDNERVAWGYMDIGAIFMNYKDYPKAGDYFTKAIDILRNHQLGAKPVLAECYINLAKVRLFEDQAREAETPLKEAFRILNAVRDSSYLPVYYTVSGMYYIRMKQWDPALADLHTGLYIAERLERTYDVLSLQYQVYEVYQQQGKLNMAKAALEKAYISYQQFPLADNRKVILYQLAKTEAALGNYKPAFNRLMEYAQLSDTLFEKRTAKEIATLEARHQAAENEKKLLRLENRSQRQQLLLYFGGAVVILLTAFFLYIYWQRKKRGVQQLQIQIAHAQLEGEERERRRLARDLHDGLGGMLAGVKLNLSAFGYDKDHRQQADLQKVIGQLDDSVHELRRIARNMMPETLLRSGLARALEELCKWMNNDRMHVEYTLLDIPEEMAHSQKMDVYRIVQELLANATRHSGAREVFLQCSGRQNRFYITIEDNGRGMPEKTAGEGMGLANIRSRIAYMQGKMELTSHEGKGTIINIEINVTANGKN